MNSPFSRNAGGQERSDRTWGLPWGPPPELDELVDRLGRWAERATGGRARSAHWTPVVEQDETADTYRVRVELPGIPRDRVVVEVEGHQLCVRGDLDEAAAGTSGYLGLRSGSFAYRTSIPADADREDVRADLVDGVLTVSVSRAGQTSRRTVPINGTSEASTVPLSGRGATLVTDGPRSQSSDSGGSSDSAGSSDSSDSADSPSGPQTDSAAGGHAAE